MCKNIWASMCICKPISITFQRHITKNYTSVSNFFFRRMMILMEKKPHKFSCKL